MMRLGILFLLLGVSQSTIVRDFPIDVRDEGDTSLGRLPLAFAPINYTLELQPDIYTGLPPFQFSGSVRIRVDCREAASILYLNSNGPMVVDGTVAISLAPDSPVQAPDPIFVRWELDEVFQFFKLFLAEDLTPGAHYVVELSFSGTMNEPSRGTGLYYESYQSLYDGQTKYIATTLMWASSAREVFPCFDEPQMKAQFDVTLVRRDGVVALATMPSIGTEDRGDGWIAETFNTTVTMSTYLLCFVIGDFGYMESYTSRGTQIRVWAIPHYVEDLAWANSVAASLQEAHEEWMDIPDPLPKMDHIAIPGFAGAMENWGLVTYAENILLYNATYSTLSNERGVAQVIAHELAHMWFGNLVTLRWWNDAWLNEGFATYFESEPLETVLGWSKLANQHVQSIRAVIARDSTNTSTSVRVNIDTPMQSTTGYSTFAYNKGGAVLLMLRQLLGPDTFQRGLRRYLNNHMFGNAVTDDLWDALTEQADLDGVTDSDGLKLFIKEKIDPWVDQRGYPLVTINRTSPGTADVTQTQFLSPQGQTVPPSPYLYEWYVPLTLASQEDPDWSADTKDWLNRHNKTITAGIPTSLDQWFVANIDQMGFYRVSYDSATYQQITDQLDLDSTVFPEATRYSILNDAIEIARAGLSSEVRAMEATRFLDDEDSHLVWTTAELGLQYPDLVLRRYSDTFAGFQGYFRSKFDPAHTRFGWTDAPEDDNPRRRARAVVLSLSCQYLNPDCESEARARFDEYLNDPFNNNIAIDHRPVSYCSALRTGSTEDWDFLHSRYLDIADTLHRSAAPERERILEALACSIDDDLLQRYINLTYDESAIRSSDAADAITALANSERGRWVLWGHLDRQWDSSPLPPGVNKFSQLLNIVEGFANADDILLLEGFVAAHPPQSDSEAARYEEAFSVVNRNKAWADENEADLRAWFLDNTPST